MNSFEKINLIQNIKNNIRTALIEKGQSPSNRFSEYSALISNIGGQSVGIFDTFENMNITEASTNDLAMVYNLESNQFGGIFKYNNGWEIAPTQFTTSDMNVMSGEYYGVNGVSSGTLGTMTYYNDSTISNLYADKLSKLYTILNSVDVSNVSNYLKIFQNMRGMRYLPNINTSTYTNMANMFNFCTSLQTVTSLNTINVTNMAYMFNTCEALRICIRFIYK